MEREKLMDAVAVMESHGGGFAKQLAKAWKLADLQNSDKLLAAFPELVERYVRMLVVSEHPLVGTAGHGRAGMSTHWEHLQDERTHGDYSDFAAWFLWKHGEGEFNDWLNCVSDRDDYEAEYGRDVDALGSPIAPAWRRKARKSK